MFLFFFIFLIVNLIVSVGYENVFNLNTDRKLHFYSFGTAIGYFIVFLTVPSIMEKLIFWGFIYEIVGLILFFRGVWIYSKNEKKERENW